jgi:hypothetical protein
MTEILGSTSERFKPGRHKSCRVATLSEEQRNAGGSIPQDHGNHESPIHSMETPVRQLAPIASKGGTRRTAVSTVRRAHCS